MGTVFCDNCGVSLLEETARFCRACGKATPPLSEAATKRFDQQPVFQTPTSPVGPSPTTPAYMAPFEFPAAAPQTIDLNRKRKRNLILVASMLAMMLFLLGGLLIFLNFGQGTPATTPILTEIPRVPQAPGVPEVPPVPPPPPVDPVTSIIDRSLIYPGSQQTMAVTSGDGKNVLQLHTDDAASKVVSWYLSKLKATKKISIAGQTILKAGDIAVVIMGGDDGAEILITQHGDD